MKIKHKQQRPSRRGIKHQKRNSANTPARKPTTCYNCGFDFPHCDKPCPAQRKTFSSCKKQNRFTRCCKQRQKNQLNREKVNIVQDNTVSDDSSEEYVYCMDKSNAHVFVLYLYFIFEFFKEGSPSAEAVFQEALR